MCIVVDKTWVPIRRAIWPSFPIRGKRVGNWGNWGGWSVPFPLLSISRYSICNLCFLCLALPFEHWQFDKWTSTKIFHQYFSQLFSNAVRHHNEFDGKLCGQASILWSTQHMQALNNFFCNSKNLEEKLKTEKKLKNIIFQAQKTSEWLKLILKINENS